jgi:hypothetical protein
LLIGVGESRAARRALAPAAAQRVLTGFAAPRNVKNGRSARRARFSARLKGVSGRPLLPARRPTANLSSLQVRAPLMRAMPALA